MHILLTDILTCPRCGPAHGLILLADEIQDRRVRSGRFGCPNCRTTFDVRDGAGHFDAVPALPLPAASPDAAVRLAALLNLRQGSRYALLAGPAAAHAHALAALLDGLEVITIGDPATDPPAGAAGDGVNPIGITHGLPFATGRVAGIALGGRFADTLLAESVRVLAPIGRLLLEPPPADAEARLQAARLRVIARDEHALVAGHG